LEFGIVVCTVLLSSQVKKNRYVPGRRSPLAPTDDDDDD